MSEDFSAKLPIKRIKTPNAWKPHCICSMPKHKYGTRETCRENKWLEFYWIKTGQSLHGDLTWLLNKVTVSNQTIRKIFGEFSVVLEGADPLRDLIHKTSTSEDRVLKKAPMKILRDALAGGYPALMHLSGCAKMLREDKFSGGDNAYQLSLMCILQGITRWLKNIQKLSDRDMSLMFVTDIKANPHIRMADLPHMGDYSGEAQTTDFLRGPVWNCSLEYLYKLAVGLFFLKPIAFHEESVHFLEEFYTDTIKNFASLLNKLKKTHGDELGNSEDNKKIAHIERLIQAIQSNDKTPSAFDNLKEQRTKYLFPQNQEDKLPIERIKTPEAWNLECTCSQPIHKYGTRETCRENKWLKVNYWPADRLELDPDLFLYIDNITLSPDTIHRIFGKFSEILKGASQIYNIIDQTNSTKNWDALNKDGEILLNALKSGYPAHNHLFGFVHMLHMHEIRNESESLQLSLLMTLSGIDRWLKNILELSDRDMFFMFVKDIKTNPHISMTDLINPADYISKLQTARFLFGPAWNCSLEYLYKLAAGLFCLKPIAFFKTSPQDLKKTYNDTIQNFASLLNKLNKMHEAVFGNSPNNAALLPDNYIEILETGDQVQSPDIIKLIQEFVYCDQKEIKKRIACIDSLIQAAQSDDTTPSEFDEMKSLRGMLISPMEL